MNALEFDRLVQKYQSLVYTICRQLVADEGYAQDLTQETFLSAWRSMDRCPAGYEKQWLARIASNKAKDYLRSAWARRVNTPGDDVLALEGAPPGSEPEAQVLEALGEEELTQRILALREPTRRPAASCCWNSTPRRRSRPALRQAPENSGGAGLPGKKDAGRAAERRRKGGLLRWNCSVKTAV